MKLLVSVFLLAASFLGFSQKEILTDKHAVETCKKCINYLDNYEFDQFDIEVEKLKKDYEKHPAYSLLKSISTYYQSLTDMNNKGENITYYNLLNNVVTYSEIMLEKDPESKEGLFFALSGYGYRAQYFSDIGSFFKAVGEGKKAYKFYKKGKEYKDELYEFYFMTGLFNYYIEQYPENHPMIKPLMGFFQKGDKEQGLQELDFACKNAIFTQGSAFTYSAYLYTKFEMNYPQAINYSGNFYESHPNNSLNKVNYIMALLFDKNYNQAYPLIQTLKGYNSNYFVIAQNLFKGWYEFEQNKNQTKALKHLKIAELLCAENMTITQDLYALICYKKAQIFEEQNKTSEAKTYYKNGLSDSSFEEVKLAYKTFQQKK